MKYLKTVLLIALLVTIFYIVSTDAANMSGQSTGAGDIWWTEAAEIDKAYKNIVR